MTSPVVIWRNQKHLSRLIGRSGVILSWTIIRVAPLGFVDQAPYPVVLVQLPDGTKITAQLVDYQPRHLHAGQKVVCVLRKLFRPGLDEIIPYGIKVKPHQVTDARV